jgi:hypothetical protein
MPPLAALPRHIHTHTHTHTHTHSHTRTPRRSFVQRHEKQLYYLEQNGLSLKSASVASLGETGKGPGEKWGVKTRQAHLLSIQT